MSDDLVNFINSKMGNDSWQSSLNGNCPAAPAFDCANVVDVPSSECDALSGLYNSTDGANWNNMDGWLSSRRVSNWYGVTVTDGHVTTVNLNNNNLVGSAQISGLEQMTELDLEENTLS